MDWNLEVVTIPVSDVDRAKAFYADKVGFVVDLDTRIGDGSRLVQLTPPGSAKRAPIIRSSKPSPFTSPALRTEKLA